MHCAHVGNTWSRTRPWPQPTTAVIVSRPAARGCARCREREHGVQTPAEHLGHVTAVGGRMPTVGEDDLPLHEMSTNSKQTTCSPLHMVCEVHHTKSGYEQLKSRNSPFRPTRSLSSPKRMRYDRFRSRCEAAGHLPARGDRRFCRAARSQMGCFARCSVVRVTPSGSPTAEGLLLTSAVEKRRSRRRNGPAALLSDIADEQFCRKL